MAAPCCRTVPLRLLLVRHGLSSFNKERRIQGRDDLSNLSEEGHEQARRLGRSLAEVPIDAIYSSPLRRAASTTTSLLEGRNAAAPKPVFDDGLLEVDLPGRQEMAEQLAGMLCLFTQQDEGLRTGLTRQEIAQLQTAALWTAAAPALEQIRASLLAPVGG